MGITNYVHSYNAAPETLHYTDREVLWSGDNISRVVAILPLHRYNPKSLGGVGTWEQTNKPYQGKKCNLFYRFQNVWSYMGTFLCVQATPIESDQLSVTSLLVCSGTIIRSMRMEFTMHP